MPDHIAAPVTAHMVRRPEGRYAPDYASKIHIVVAPVYYHNYALGELFASQVHHAMCKKALGGISPHDVSYYGDARVGQFVHKSGKVDRSHSGIPAQARHETPIPTAH